MTMTEPANMTLRERIELQLEVSGEIIVPDAPISLAETAPGRPAGIQRLLAAETLRCPPERLEQLLKEAT